MGVKSFVPLRRGEDSSAHKVALCHWRICDVSVSPLEDNRIVIVGGSGFLGISLAHHLAERGGSPVILSRNVPKVSGPWRHRLWDGRTLGEWRDELNRAAGMVNLAGRNVNCIKTPDHQDEILRSRVESTRVLGEAIRSINLPPPVWVQMSTAHIYGDPPRAVCSEKSALGYGLAPVVGRAWEEAFRASVLPSQRGVILRTSFVLGRDRGAGGGALSTLGLLARMGLGGYANGWCRRLVVLVARCKRWVTVLSHEATRHAGQASPGGMWPTGGRPRQR